LKKNQVFYVKNVNFSCIFFYILPKTAFYGIIFLIFKEKTGSFFGFGSAVGGKEVQA